MALRASLGIYYFISNAGSWDNCSLFPKRTKLPKLQLLSSFVKKTPAPTEKNPLAFLVVNLSYYVDSKFNKQ